MKSAIVILALFIFLYPASAANKHAVRDAALLVAAHNLFAALDALIYPKVQSNLTIYRIGQHLFLAAQTYGLKELSGWDTAGGYLFSHWSFNNDHLYYFWYNLFYGENHWREEIWEDNCTWARWTWMGLGESYFTGRWNEPIKGIVLVAGGAIGIGVEFSLVIF